MMACVVVAEGLRGDSFGTVIARASALGCSAISLLDHLMLA